MATPVIAFDIYGTLIDPHGVGVELEQLIGERAQEFSRRWRDKQLEYTFRRGLMRQYVDFSVCTRQALDYCDTVLGTRLSEADKQRLLQQYASLPAFADVAAGLAALQQVGIRMVAFSNGTAAGVNGLLEQAGIRDRFSDIISVDEIGSYKPDPAVYQHCLARTGAAVAECWLVSANPFDILGAAAVGMPTAWVQRDPGVAFDPWETRPTASIEQLTDLIKVVRNHE
ncbi:MAG: haloacid dehalogenase type II [Thiohalophilus sp.]